MKRLSIEMISKPHIFNTVCASSTAASIPPSLKATTLTKCDTLPL